MGQKPTGAGREIQIGEAIRFFRANLTFATIEQGLAIDVDSKWGD
jgi:hypothetical protein